MNVCVLLLNSRPLLLLLSLSPSDVCVQATICGSHALHHVVQAMRAHRENASTQEV